MGIFRRFQNIAVQRQSQKFTVQIGRETPEKFTGRTPVMSMFNDISCGSRDNEQECLANARLVSLYGRRFGIGQWSFIGLGSEKKWFSVSEDSPQRIWDKYCGKEAGVIRRERMSNFPCYDSIVQRSIQRQRTWCSRPGND